MLFPVHFCDFFSCFTSCKSWTFYTIFEILHIRNLKHNYKLIYDIEINLKLYIIMFLVNTIYIYYTNKYQFFI